MYSMIDMENIVKLKTEWYFFQDFQASIVVENSMCESPGCRKCEQFSVIQDSGGLFKTLKVQILYNRIALLDSGISTFAKLTKMTIGRYDLGLICYYALVIID